jgi:hypothetical protein
MRRLLLLADFAAAATGLPMIRAARAARMGDYDETRKWHDTDWWFHHHPNWVWAHHPDWVRAHAEWRHDGDRDEQHRWHDRAWWMQHRHDWVQRFHPDWR